MNWLDLVIVAVVLLYLLGGANRGTVRSILSLTGFLAGVYLASHLYQPISSVLRMMIGDTTWAEFAAFVVVFFIVSGLAAWIGSLAGKHLRLPKKSALDKLVGAVLGLIEGVLVTQLFVILFVKFPIFELVTAAIQKSMIADLYLRHPDVLQALLPPKFL